MQFKDYYKILEIPQTASYTEIRKAYKSLAIKWHPDKNPGIDTTKKMQKINEAYVILKDEEARSRYDKEYSNYQDFKKEAESRYATSEEYEFNDETLKQWMQNASKQAVDLAKKTLKEIQELSVTATKAAGNKIGQMIITYSIIGVLLTLIIRTCS